MGSIPPGSTINPSEIKDFSDEHSRCNRQDRAERSTKTRSNTGKIRGLTFCDCSQLAIGSLRQKHIDRLSKLGVPPVAIVHPTITEIAEIEGVSWLCFPEQFGWVLWQPTTGEIMVDDRRIFALGEDLIDDPSATALDQWLHIFATPLDWLRAARRGIVVLRWDLAFDMLRDVDRIALSEQLLGTYKQSMRPRRLPKLGVIQEASAAA